MYGFCFVLARKLAAEAAESAEMCSELDRVSALLRLNPLRIRQNVAPFVELWCARKKNKPQMNADERG